MVVGNSVKIGYFAQHAMELLEPERTVWQTLECAFPKASVGSLRTLAGCFGFSGDEIEKRCRVLSGGEKARLVLALMLFDPPNFLVLDEPTNHLDVGTKEMLVRALAGYDGTMIFVSPRPALPRRALQPRAGADAGRAGPLRRRLHRVRGPHRPRGPGHPPPAGAHLGRPDHPPSSFFITFPMALRGSASTMRTARGRL